MFCVITRFPCLLGLLAVAACSPGRFPGSASPSRLAPGPAPALVLLRGEDLARVKARLANDDTTLLPALRALVAEADSALHAGPFTVTDKRRPAASGDPHDYTSLGSYWWPDSTKVDGLPYVRRDGRRNPAGAGPDFDARRRGRMEQAVHALALGYYFTGYEAYARHAAELLRVWFLDSATGMNPNLDYAQAIPGITAGRGIGIIDTHSFPVLLDDLVLLRPSPSWTEADRHGMQRWMTRYLAWLRTSPNGRDEQAWPNNHGSWYDVQAASIALFTGQRALARQIVEAAETLRIAKQIRPDGSQPLELERTRSLHYSAFNLEALMELAEIGDRVDVDLWHYRAPNGASIRRALDYLAPFADPARVWPHEEITPVEPELLFRPLRRAQRVWTDPRYDAWLAKIPTSALQSSVLRLLYPAPAAGFGG